MFVNKHFFFSSDTLFNTPLFLDAHFSYNQHMPLNGLLHPTDLGILLSYRCTSGCAHCVYNCGQEWKDWMHPRDLRSALRTAKSEWPENLQVHLTGGEVFLNFALLLSGVRAAADLDIPIYAETNAVWCVEDDLVEQRFTALREAGMRALLVSCSPFHAATVPLIRTLRARNDKARACAPGLVICACPDDYSSRLRPWNSSSISRLSSASIFMRSLNEMFLAFSSNRYWSRSKSFRCILVWKMFSW